MGAGSFDVKAYEKQAKEAKVSKNSGFTAVSMCDEFNPVNVSTRFSKKGPFNNFKDVITVLVGLDVTGSMDIIPKSLLQGKLGSLMVDLKKTYNKPNENLQISFAGIGDAKSDEAPLQVTHFESDNRFAQQLQKIWLEGHGGGNGGESYNLLWWYAANKTHLNYIKQDARKGILITIGDDNVHPSLTASEIQMWLDPNYQGGDISNEVLLHAAKEQYNVYHIVITDGHAYNYDYPKKATKTEKQKQDEAKQWANLLGDNNVIYTKSSDVADAIAEVIKRHRPVQSLDMTELSEQQWEKQIKENLTDLQWEEVLSYTLCPLTGKYMTNPVELGDGKRAYEKEALENYVQTHHKDPLTSTNLTLENLVYKPNLNIAQLCLSYKPFFESLPSSRREKLIHDTRQRQMPIEQKKVKESSQNPYAYFAKSDSALITNKSANLQLSLECPLTLEIMQDPVMLIESGQTYERLAIENWLKNNNVDPLTRKALKDKTLVPNYAVKSLCEQLKAQFK